MPHEEADIRAVTEALVEALYAGDPDTFAGVRAGFGAEGGVAPYNTVQIGGSELLAGGAWNGGALDSSDPSAGPNPDTDGNSGISLLVRAIALVAHAKTDPSTAPGVDDDETEGYRPGKLWIVGTGPTFTIYVLCDASAGAAVWQDITSGGGGGGGTTLKVGGASVAATCNLSNTTPAAPASSLNVKWQKDGGGANVSAYLGVDGTTLVVSGGALAVGSIAESQVTGLVSDLGDLDADILTLSSAVSSLSSTVTALSITVAGKADASLTVTGTAPVLVNGDHAAHALSANLTITVADATTSAKGAVQLEADSADVSAGHAVTANDTRLSNARTPTGPAGGQLAGTYPNPTVASVDVSALPAYIPAFLSIPKRLSASLTIPAGYAALARSPFQIDAGVNVTIGAGGSLEVTGGIPDAGFTFVRYDPDAVNPEYRSRLVSPSTEFVRDFTLGTWTKQFNPAGAAIQGPRLVQGGMEVLFPGTSSGAFSGIYADVALPSECWIMASFDVTCSPVAFVYLGMALLEAATTTGDIYQIGTRGSGNTLGYVVSKWTAYNAQGGADAVLFSNGVANGRVYVAIQMRGSLVYAWMGSSPDSLIALDNPTATTGDTMTFTPTRLCFGGYASGPTTRRAARMTVQSVRVAPIDFINLPNDVIPPRLYGARVLQLAT